MEGGKVMRAGGRGCPCVCVCGGVLGHAPLSGRSWVSHPRDGFSVSFMASGGITGVTTGKTVRSAGLLV